MLIGAAPPAAAPAASPASGSGSITVTVTDIRNSRGVVRACLTGDARDFPDCKKATHAQRAVVPAGATVTLRFDDVAPGRYAIALIHDENDNNRMDRAMLMMPKEGYGFSRDAKVVMGPPRFSAAAFDVGAEPAHATIRMRYMF